MNSLSKVGDPGDTPPRRGTALLLGVLITLVMLGLAGLVLQADSGLGLMVGATLCMAMLLLAMGAIGWHLGVRLTRQHLGELLRESRMQTQALAQLQRDWHWASDGDLHLVRWQPPRDAVASSWVGAAATQTLFERFQCPADSELRATLNARRNFDGLPARDEAGQQWLLRGNDHVDRISGAAARMQGMIDALLSLSQLSARPLLREPVNLSQLAGAIMEDLCRGEPSREVALHVEPGLMAEGDPLLLRLALENLLGNAWKYSTACPSTQIRFECRMEPGRRIFLVSDCGAGFDMRFADRLFGAFQRLHSASEFPGTGMGLASVRRIVRRHGGDCWAEGAVGEGARFYFTLG